MLKSSRFALASVLLSTLTLSACAGPAVGQHLELTGKLVLRGTAEFNAPAVVTKDAGVWALEGLSPATVASRQNTQVRVHGTVTRTKEALALLPTLRVDSLEALKD